MQFAKAGLIIFIATFLSLVATATITAQGPITVRPSQVRIAGIRGQIAVRQILLQSDTPLNGVRLIPQDLIQNSASNVFPANAIQMAPVASEAESQTLKANDVLTVPVRFDLRGVPSGEFTGELLILHNDGSLTVPLSIIVKDRPWRPLIVLLLGIALGVGVSTYRAQVRPRDEILVRISQLRAQMRADSDLPAPFSRQIESLLADVEAVVQAESWDAASTSMTQAEQTWLTWRRSSDDWLDLLSYRQKLLERLTEDDMNPDGNYEQEVQRHLEDAFRTMPTMASPDQFRIQLREIADQVNDYTLLQQAVEQLQDMQARIPADHPSYEVWRQKSFKINQQVATLLPDDVEGRKLLHTQIQNTLAEIEDTLLQEATAKGGGDAGVSYGIAGRGSGDGLLNMVAKRIPSAPTVRGVYTEARATAARSRLTIFTWISYFVVVLGLAIAGFGELYIDKAAFGANTWGDYFALLGWGFGAEATRASVMGLLRGVEEKQSDGGQ